MSESTMPDERREAAMADHEVRPTKNEQGKWDALDAHGYGTVLGYDTAREVEIWIDGYDTGARENM